VLRLGVLRSNELLDDCSLIIPGPISTRGGGPSVKSKLQNLLEISKKTGLKLIVVTYPKEFPEEMNHSLFSVVTVKDPGPDIFPSHEQRSAVPNRNTSRMIQTTLAGVCKAETQFALKSRIELIPTDFQFAYSIMKLREDFKTNTEFKISVGGQWYQGLTKYKKGTFLWLPDTVQFMKTLDMRALWETAAKLWLKNMNHWNYKVKAPLANEQILGLSFTKITGNSLSEDMIKSFQRYTFNKSIYKTLGVWEKNIIKTYTHIDLALPINRVNNPRHIDRKHVILPLHNSKKLPFYLTCQIRQKLFIFFLVVSNFRSRFSLFTLIFWKKLFQSRKTYFDH
jgi:hypothetical protein